MLLMYLLACCWILLMGNLDKIPLHLVRHVTKFGWKRKKKKKSETLKIMLKKQLLKFWFLEVQHGTVNCFLASRPVAPDLILLHHYKHVSSLQVLSILTHIVFLIHQSTV